MKVVAALAGGAAAAAAAATTTTAATTTAEAEAATATGPQVDSTDTNVVTCNLTPPAQPVMEY